MEDLLRKYVALGTTSAGELYLPVSVARELLAECSNASVAILGIEAARIVQGRIHPMIDQIADFSSLQPWHAEGSLRASVRAASEFLDQLPDDPQVHVTFTLAELTTP